MRPRLIHGDGGGGGAGGGRRAGRRCCARAGACERRRRGTRANLAASARIKSRIEAVKCRVVAIAARFC